MRGKSRENQNCRRDLLIATSLRTESEDPEDEGNYGVLLVMKKNGSPRTRQYAFIFPVPLRDISGLVESPGDNEFATL